MSMVGSYRLPASLDRLLERMNREGIYCTFRLKECVDAYDNRFHADLEIWSMLVGIGHPMQEWLNPKLIRRHDAFYADDPSFLPHPTDYSELVCFGQNGEGDSFYYLDYRDGSNNPSVIYQAGMWRRVAPEFDSFLALFEPVGPAERDAG